jgi:hypothetical protein
MVRKQGSKAAGDADLSREDRLKAALKANLARRKAQSRMRTGAGATDEATREASRQDKDN